MSETAIRIHPKCQQLQEHYYERRGWVHAYAHYRQAVNDLLDANAAVLDVGCGQTFPAAKGLLARTPNVFGVDPVADPAAIPEGAHVRRATGESLPFDDGQFDLVICQSVLEHVERPARMFAQVYRVLRTPGAFVFLTPSRFDYISLAAVAIPNRWHPWLVRMTEGRDEDDTFPTFYRANSRGRIGRLAARAGLRIERLEYLHHCPSHFMSHPVLYRLAAFYDRVVCGPAPLDFLRGWLLGVLRKD